MKNINYGTLSLIRMLQLGLATQDSEPITQDSGLSTRTLNVSGAFFLEDSRQGG